MTDNRPEVISLDDARREDRIRELSRLMKLALRNGKRDELRNLYEEMRAAVLSRSPAQVARMESRIGAL